MKNLFLKTFFCMVLIMLIGCGKNNSAEEGKKQESNEKEKTKIVLAVRADGIDMAEAIREDVKKAGYELEIKTGWSYNRSVQGCRKSGKRT